MKAQKNSTQLDYIGCKIVSLGFYMEQIKSQKGGFIEIYRAFKEKPQRKFYGLGFVSFGPRIFYKDKTKDLIFGFQIKETKKNVKYLNIFRYLKKEKRPQYYLITVLTNEQIKPSDLFTSKSSQSFIVSYAGWDRFGWETMLLVQNMDIVRLDGEYYESRDGKFRKSTPSDCEESAGFITNRI